jgi:hypothetical protein
MARYEPGQSGNVNGRPTGVKGKLSTKKLAEELGKRTLSAIQKVHELMQISDNPNVQLKSAIALIVEDKKARELVFKEIQEQLKIEQQRIDLEISKKRLEEMNNTSKPEDNKLKQSKPAAVLSFKAVD